MLKRRVLTAIALVVPLVAALYWLPSRWLMLLFGVVVFLGAREWATLSGLTASGGRRYAAAMTVGGGLLTMAVLIWPPLVWPVLGLAAAWWIVAFIGLGRDAGVFHSRAGKLAGGVLVLVPMWVAAIFLHHVDPDRPRLLLYVMALVWLADSVAYLTGSTLGRTKLAPRISPGKTVEGVAGALIAVVLTAYVCGTILWQFNGIGLVAWIVLAAVVTVVSVVGDLVESKVKRVAGVKDSGTLLPGHGGVLDRIDALTSGIPLFVLGWLVLMRLSL